MNLPRFVNGHFVFLVVVLAAYVTIFTARETTFTTADVLLLLLLGLLYLVLGTVGFEYCLRQPTKHLFWLYFPVQFLLGGTIVYLSLLVGFAAFLLLPLTAHAVIALSGWGAALVSTVTVLLLVAIVGGLASWSAAINAGASFAAGVLFVVVFSYLTLREEQARKEVERLLAELQEANDQLRQYALQVEELATVKERNRLAREIHDSLGHYLTVINVQVQGALAVLETDPARAKSALQKAQTLSQEGLAEVRHSVAALRTTPTENRTLAEALAELVEENRAAGIVTQLTLLGDDRTLAPSTALTLYRAAQEGLTNVRKHARASRVDLTLDYRQPGQVQLIIQDNGVGGQAPGNGFGLLGIRERVQLLQGEMAVETDHRQGFRLSIRLPG